nr:reverse transcriptase domain-containing protein [Tanacetum cinerariifolium]
MTLELANRAICTPDGIVRDVFVPVGKFTFSADFVVVDYESDPRVPLILGRPFLRTARALINVHGEEMILCDGDERLTLNMKHDTASYSNHPHRESVNLINIFNLPSEDCLEDLVSNKQSDNPTFLLHKEIASLKVIHEIHDSKGCTFLSEEVPNIDSFNDIHPHFDDDPLSGSTTFSANSLLEEFTDELALISYSPDYDDNLACDIESDIREIEFLLYQGKDSDFKDSIDKSVLTNHDDLFVDPTPEMFSDEQPPDYSFPSRFDVYPDDLLEIESDDNFDDDSFDSKGEKIKEAELLIDQLDLPCDILSEYEYCKNHKKTRQKRTQEQKKYARAETHQEKSTLVDSHHDQNLENPKTVLKCMCINSYFPNNSSSTIPRCQNKRRTPNIVEPELRTIVEMADNRTMEELLQAPTEGKCYSLYDKEPSNFILTWEDLVNKFVNQFFPPSKTTHLKNEICRFTQRFEETFGEACERFKEMLRACPHHGFTELAQIDTFYNGLNDNDQESLNAAAGGNLLSKTTREALQIIENKSKVCYSRNKPNVSRMNTTSRENASKSDDRTDKLADQISTLVDIFVKKIVTPAPVKAVEEFCVTCGGNHAYYNCTNTDSNQLSVCVATGTYNQVAPQKRASNFMDKMKAITTRSGVAYEGPSIPTPKKEPDISKTLPKPNIPYPLILNDQKLYEKATNQMEKFFQIFQNLHFDISFADALILMPGNEY